MRLARTIIHEMPAMALAAKANHGLVRQSEKRQADCRADRTRCDHSIRPQLVPQPRQTQRSKDSTSADGPQEHAVKGRAGGDLIARHQRKERPVGAGEEEKPNGPHQCRAQRRAMPHMAQPRDNGTDKPLCWKPVSRRPRGTPPQECADDYEDAGSIDPERSCDPQGSNDHAAKRRSQGAADVDAHAVGHNGSGQILRRYELRYDCLPRGRCQGCANAKKKSEHEQQCGRDQAEPDKSRDRRGDHRKSDLHKDEKSTPVDDVSKRARR